MELFRISGEYHFFPNFFVENTHFSLFLCIFNNLQPFVAVINIVRYSPRKIRHFSLVLRPFLGYFTLPALLFIAFHHLDPIFVNIVSVFFLDSLPKTVYF